MAYDHGFGDLENKLIDLFQPGIPDFEAAEALLRQGADINAVGRADDENVLSEILGGDWWSMHDDTCEHGGAPGLGQFMCAIIRFFLAHGFDVNKRDGCFGAQCLWALTLSSYDRSMIEATKLLLDAGAKNRTTSPASADQGSTPWRFIALEGSYQRTCEADHAIANLFEAVYQVYQAVEDGRPYGGIDSYELAVGKTIQKVLAEGDGDHPTFFSLDLPECKRDHCFTKTLYFVYDGGALLSTQYAEFWTDTVLPTGDLVDVSAYFDGIVGSAIRGFTFDHRSVVKGNTEYGQPITTMEMDSGYKVRFSINFGEVREEERAAYFERLAPLPDS